MLPALLIGRFPRISRLRWPASWPAKTFRTRSAEARGLRFKFECGLCGGGSVQPLARGFLYRNSFLAFFRVNRQSILVRFRLALPFQASISRCNVSRSRNPPAPQTWPRDQTEFDFRPIEPAPVLRSEMDGDPVPKAGGNAGPMEPFRKGITACRYEWNPPAHDCRAVA